MSIRLRIQAAALAALGLSLAGLAVVPAAGAAPSHDKIVSAVPSANTPAVNDGEVDAIVQVGTTVVVGGTFSSVTPSGGTAQSRNYIFAFNASTGALISTFRPTLNGAVNDLVAGPTAGTVYVGGSFTQVNGSAASHVTLLDVASGGVSGGFRAASTNGVVNTLVYRSGRLFVGGNFTTAGGAAHGGLASLNATTGTLDSYVNDQVAIRHNDSGSGAQGAVGVRDMDINAAGTRLVAIGNFKQVDGQSRDQLVMLSLGSSSSTVTGDWRTTRYSPYCFNWAFDTYVRGVSFSPDGSFFVVNATGGQNAGTLCDTAARFETNASGSDVQPTWVDYTGGDTLWAVTVTEKAVYVGGHQRWLNNSLASDYAGPGAVPRPGLAALDLDTGMPLKWNPGRNPRGAAVYALYATPQGLWLGSDTDYIGAHYAYKRPKLAFFPLSGGAAEASDATPALPGTAYAGGRTGQNGNVLYRVNAAGSALGALDAGPDWSADDGTYHNAGSNAASWGSGASTDSTVPASTPNAVFDSELWSPSDNPAMNWDFPVPAGLPIQVKLYFANRCSCTSGVGQRVFDVSIDGSRVLDHFDIVAATGDQRGTMRAFTLTSDGNVDIDFQHEVENPLINAIEIVRTDQPPPTSGDNTLTAIPLTASGAGAGVAASSAGIDWSNLRGSFVAGGRLYYGRSDGTFDYRPYTGTTFGAQTAIDPYHDPDWDGVSTGSGNTFDGVLSNFYGEIPSITGMAYAGGRLYYHVNGGSVLYWRWFNVDSGIVGSDRFTVSSPTSFAGTMGMIATGGKLYYATRSDGNLNAIGLSGSATSGTPSVVDGPSSGGNDWRSRALFLSSTSTPTNTPPTARFTVQCVQLTCTFDGSASSDADGSVASYSWTFGDGATGTGQTATHTYAAGGSYTAGLVVTDDQGATGQVTHTANPTEPSGGGAITYEGGSTAAANSATPRVTLPSQVQAGDLMVMTATLNSVTEATAPSGWTLLDQEPTTGATTYVWTREATSGDAGASRTVTLGASTKSVLTVVAYDGVDAATPVAGHATATDASTSSHTSPTLTVPADSTIVTFWSDKSPSTSAWTPPAGVHERVDVYSAGTGRVSALVADSPSPADGHAGALTATTDVTSSRGISWTIALNPA